LPTNEPCSDPARSSPHCVNDRSTCCIVLSNVDLSPHVSVNRRRATWSDAGRDEADGSPEEAVDDVALLEAAGERMRHHDGD
jgi:hypothetical protein